MLKHCRSEAVLICLHYIVIIKVTELFRLEKITKIKARILFFFLIILSLHIFSYLSDLLVCALVLLSISQP